MQRQASDLRRVRQAAWRHSQRGDSGHQSRDQQNRQGRQPRRPRTTRRIVEKLTKARARAQPGASGIDAGHEAATLPRLEEGMTNSGTAAGSHAIQPADPGRRRRNAMIAR